jgi:hypothetical protein
MRIADRVRRGICPVSCLINRDGDMIFCMTAMFNHRPSRYELIALKTSKNGSPHDDVFDETRGPV